ncbi:cyclin-dependent kinase 1-like, partial [Paramuricea clavata]
MEKRMFKSSSRTTYRATGSYVKVVVNNDMTLRELQEACCKAFLQNVEDLDDVLKSYDIAVIDGKSPIVSDHQISHKRRTFGFYWKKKGNSEDDCALQTTNESTNSLASALKISFNIGREGKKCIGQCFSSEDKKKVSDEFGTTTDATSLPPQYDPCTWGWELTGLGIITPDKEEINFIERDLNAQEESLDIKLCGISSTTETRSLIAYGPDLIIGVDGDNNLIIGCISNHHCTMVVDYAWFRDGVPIKEGRKASFIIVQEKGSFQCIVKVNDSTETSTAVKIVEVADPIKERGQNENSASYGVNSDDICKQEVVGRGQFGTVYKGKWRGTDVAIKAIQLPPEYQDGSNEKIKELQIC